MRKPLEKEQLVYVANQAGASVAVFTRFQSHCRRAQAASRKNRDQSGF